MKQKLKNQPSFDYQKVDNALKGVKHWSDLMKDDGPMQLMFKESLQRMMQAELEEHLGYPPRNRKEKDTDNSRNGSYPKSLKTSSGVVELEIPRDRDGTFKPHVVPKYESVDSKLEEQIISMYAKGMTNRDISSHIRDIYMGVEISPTLISKITDKIIDSVKEWQSRPLNSLYPVIFLDAIHYKVRSEGKVLSKAAYVVLGIDVSGRKDILGIYIGENESSSFWLNVLTDLNTRGVEDILIACIDGLKGFPEAIKSIFPKTEVQLCIIHQIRHSLKYIVSKDQKEFMKDLKPVYRAIDEDQALDRLTELGDKWRDKYPVVIRSWENNWDNLSAYFKYSMPIRKIIYTTNIIEGFNRQLRKVTKNRSLFPTDSSLLKLMYLATKDVMKKWTKPKTNWAQTISQLSIFFEGRVKLKLK